jgi:hypothetical protein
MKALYSGNRNNYLRLQESLLMANQEALDNVDPENVKSLVVHAERLIENNKDSLYRFLEKIL